MNSWGGIDRVVDEIPDLQKNSRYTKIVFLSRYCLSIDSVIFCDLKVEVYLVGNDGEFDMFE
jgi:hypothetical protein